MTVPVGGAGNAAALARLLDPGVLQARAQGAAMRAGGASDDFLSVIKRAVGEVEGLQVAKDDILARFLRGEAVEMHEVMAAAQEANLGLEMLVEMRNKMTTALQTLMQVQI